MQQPAADHCALLQTNQKQSSGTMPVTFGQTNFYTKQHKCVCVSPSMTCSWCFSASWVVHRQISNLKLHITSADSRYKTAKY